jgi:non-canonical purine NTP pyrophosphatase (RdgB/HAM1 family)
VTAPFPEGLVFVTSNAGKAREASHFLGREVEARPLELLEIQSLSFVEVVRAKAVDAARRLGVPVLVDDSGLSFPAWNGFPGPLTKATLEGAGIEGLARMAGLVPGRRAEAVAALAIGRPGDGPEAVLVAEGRVPGTIAPRPRGSNGFGWDPIFVPDGSDRTWAEMTAEEKNLLSHRSRAFAALAALLGAPA